MNIKFDDKFVSYFVCDSDGNSSDGTYAHPDEAYTALTEIVAGAEDWDCYRLVGMLGVSPGSAIEAPVTLLTAYRAGPPGSTRIKLMHPALPWLTVEVPSTGE